MATLFVGLLLGFFFLGCARCSCVRVCTANEKETFFPLFTNHVFIGQIRKSVCVCVYVFLCAFILACMSVRVEVNSHSKILRLILWFLTEKKKETSFSRVELLNSIIVYFLLVFRQSEFTPTSPDLWPSTWPLPIVSSFQSSPVYPESRDVCVSFFALNSTVNTTNFKAYHFPPLSYTSPQCLSAHCLPLPQSVCACVRVCVYKFAWMHEHTMCSCASDRGALGVSNEWGHISYIYLHTLLVHNWHPSLSCLMRYHCINLLTK